MERGTSFGLVAFLAGEMQMFAGQPVIRLRMDERFRIFILPRYRVDQLEFGAIVFRMAMAAFGCFIL